MFNETVTRHANDARVKRAFRDKSATHVLATFAGDSVSDVRTFANETDAFVFVARRMMDIDARFALYTRTDTGIAPVLGTQAPAQDTPANMHDASNARIASVIAQDTPVSARTRTSARKSAQTHTDATPAPVSESVKKDAKMTRTSKSARTITDAQIVEFLQATRPDAIARTDTGAITTLENAARVATITDKMRDTTGALLRAYIRTTGETTIETIPEYKLRRDARTSARVANKSAQAPANVAPVATPARKSAQTDAQAHKSAIDNAIMLLRDAGILTESETVKTPAPVSARVASKSARVASKSATPAPVVATPAPARNGHAQNDREIATICTYLAKLNTTRAKFERDTKQDLDTLRVMQLRDIKAQLRARVASKSN